MIKEKNTFLSYIIPTYDEITLFALGFTCSLLLTAGAFAIKWEGSGWASTVSNVKALAFIGFFLAGLVLCIHHAFTDRPKTAFEKTLMLLFAVLLNVMSGIMAGDYYLESSEGWLVIFPIMNIVSGALLLMLLRARVITADNISDENVSRGQVVLTGTLIIILFIVCHYMFDFLWTQTLSICVAYSTNMNRGVQVLFARLMTKKGLAL